MGCYPANPRKVGQSKYHVLILLIRSFIILAISLLSWVPIEKVSQGSDYIEYHQRVLQAEEQIALENYSRAIELYEELFEQFEFVFLRDYQRATQLALHLGNHQLTEALLRQAISSGWSEKSIKKNKFLSSFRQTSHWKAINKDYALLREQYENRIDADLRQQVKKMFSRDQKKALGALFKFGSKGQDRYAEKKFAPHSKDQMTEFQEILNSDGYPGERLIGNDYWMSTILSHHNSISQDHAMNDTIYPGLKPYLMRSLKNGQVSPFELALIDEWYIAVKSGRTSPGGYGILDPPTEKTLERFNEMRKVIMMRPIQLRNQLVEIERKTGMDFYLEGTPWIDGKIEILKE